MLNFTLQNKRRYFLIEKVSSKLQFKLYNSEESYKVGFDDCLTSDELKKVKHQNQKLTDERKSTYSDFVNKVGDSLTPNEYFVYSGDTCAFSRGKIQHIYKDLEYSSLEKYRQDLRTSTRLAISYLNTFLLDNISCLESNNNLTSLVCCFDTRINVQKRIKAPKYLHCFLNNDTRRIFNLEKVEHLDVISNIENDLSLKDIGLTSCKTITLPIISFNKLLDLPESVNTVVLDCRNYDHTDTHHSFEYELSRNSSLKSVDQLLEEYREKYSNLSFKVSVSKTFYTTINKHEDGTEVITIRTSNYSNFDGIIIDDVGVTYDLTFGKSKAKSARF